MIKIFKCQKVLSENGIALFSVSLESASDLSPADYFKSVGCTTMVAARRPESAMFIKIVKKDSGKIASAEISESALFYLINKELFIVQGC
jgi:hypothetical protein